MNSKWQRATLKDLCIVDWGNTSLTKSAYVENGAFLAVSAAGCDGRIGHKEHLKHTPVLSAIGAQCGKMFFPEEDFTAIKNTITLTPKEGMCFGKFLYYLFTFIELPQRGAGQPFISKGDIQKFPIAYPSLPEQKRIVGILDEAFEGIATAKANAEKNLQNARALFESHLQSFFTKRGDEWVEAMIGDVCTLRSGTTVPVAIERSMGSKPYVKVAEMTMPANRNGIQTSIRFLNESDVKPSWVIPAGAVIFPKRGGAILTNKKRLVLVDICADLNIMSVIPSDMLTPDFLYFYFLTVDMRKLGSGSSIPQINNYDIAPLQICFPKSKTQQRVIVDGLRVFDAECQTLAANYEQKIAALEALKKSLLHEAFNGELGARAA
jgi:type I restriction enzyme S subunit